MLRKSSPHACGDLAENECVGFYGISEGKEYPDAVQAVWRSEVQIQK